MCPNKTQEAETEVSQRVAGLLIGEYIQARKYGSITYSNTDDSVSDLKKDASIHREFEIPTVVRFRNHLPALRAPMSMERSTDRAQMARKQSNKSGLYEPLIQLTVISTPFPLYSS